MFEFDSNSEMMFEFEFFMFTLNFYVFNLGMTYTVFCVDSIENDQIALKLKQNSTIYWQLTVTISNSSN